MVRTAQEGGGERRAARSAQPLSALSPSSHRIPPHRSMRRESCRPSAAAAASRVGRAAPPCTPPAAPWRPPRTGRAAAPLAAAGAPPAGCSFRQTPLRRIGTKNRSEVAPAGRGHPVGLRGGSGGRRRTVRVAHLRKRRVPLSLDEVVVAEDLGPVRALRRRDGQQQQGGTRRRSGFSRSPP